VELEDIFKIQQPLIEMEDLEELRVKIVIKDQYHKEQQGQVIHHQQVHHKDFQEETLPQVIKMEEEEELLEDLEL
jgi:hypothetical protein